MSDSVQSHRRQPTRLPPVPGVLQARTLEWVAISFSNAWKWKVKVKLLSRVWLLAVAQSCLTLSDPMDCSLPGSYVQGIFKARVLEWGAIAFSGVHGLRVVNHTSFQYLKHLTVNLQSTFDFTLNRQKVSLTAQYSCLSRLFLEFKGNWTGMELTLLNSITQQQSALYLCVLVTQSCLMLCHPVDCSPPGFSVHGVLQARIVEWVPILFSRGFSWPRVSCIAGRFFTIWATKEACSPLNGNKKIF